MVKNIKYLLVAISAISILFLLVEMAAPLIVAGAFQTTEGRNLRDTICKQVASCTEADLGLAYAAPNSRKVARITLVTATNPKNLPDASVLADKAREIASNNGNWLMRMLSNRIEVKFDNHRWTPFTPSEPVRKPGRTRK